MGKKLSFAITAILVGMLLVSCATTQKCTPLSSPEQPFELGKLSFLAPPGEGWLYTTESTTSVKYVQFMKEGARKPQGFIVRVAEIITDNPVASEDELWSTLMPPYSEGLDSQKRFEVLAMKCDRNENFSKVGVFCFGEGKDQGMPGISSLEAVTYRGHSFAFVHPDNKRLIGAIEYYERGSPERLSADTKTLVGQFAGNVSFRK